MTGDADPYLCEAAHVYNSHKHVYIAHQIARAGAPGLRVADGCNGLSVLGLFAGFVLAYPGSVVRRMLFIPLGVLVIYGVNVGRLVTPAAVQETFSLGQVGTQLRALYKQALASCG